MIDRATALLQAFARSDTNTVASLCAEDVVLFGTDEEEVWHGLAAVVAALEGAFDLDVSWAGAPVVRDNWVAGRAEFMLADATKLPVRVSMVFRDGKLAHAHYSISAASSGS